MRLKLLLIAVAFFFSPLIGEEPPFLTLEEVILETLKYQWSVQTSELAIVTQEGLLQQATGAFNPLFTADWSKFYQKDIQNPLGTKTRFDGRTTNTTVSLQTLARLGTTYSLNFTNQNVHNPTFAPINPTDATTMGVSINQPLLRNLLYSPQTTLEEVQRLQLRATKLENIENIATAIVNSITAYWQFVSAKLTLDILVDIEERFCQLAQYADELVKEQQQGYTTVYQPHADLHLATANRVQGEQNLKSAFNALLLSMGFIPDDRQALPDFDVEDFPDFDEFCGLDKSWYDTLVETIPLKRADIIASQVLIEAAKLNLTSAKNSLLPEANIIGIANVFNSRAMNKAKHVFDSTNFHSPEKDYTIGINFSFPTFNDTARGLVKQQRAAKDQAIVNRNLLESQIISGFKTSYTLYNALLEEVRKTAQASEEYKMTVAAEKLKLEMGLSTYFVVLTLENNWLSAELQAISAATLFVQNLLQLRLFSGTLVQWGKGANIDGVEDVLSYPMMHEMPCYPIECFIDDFCELTEEK